MARRSQYGVLVPALFLVSLLCTSCIVAEPPDYGAPQRSPPFMSQPHPNPLSFQALSTTPGMGSVAFTVVVRAEDAGEQLASAFYVDFKHDGQYLVTWRLHGDESFDQPRTITYNFDPAQFFTGRPPSCHTLTLMAMHLNNWDPEKGPLDQANDYASVTWYISVDDTGIVLTSSCPS